MKTRLLTVALLAALAAVAALAFAAFGGAADGTRASNGAHAGRASATFTPNSSKFKLVAGVENTTNYLYNKGFAPFTHPGTGVYCLPALKPTKYSPYKAPAVVTVDWYNSNGDGLLAYISYDTGGCGANDYVVRTYDLTGTETDEVAFVIAVP